MKRLLLPILGVLTIASASHAGFGDPYKFRNDRFDGKKTASYSPTSRDCRLTESVKSSLFSCFFMHSTESKTAYPSIVFLGQSDGWDVMKYKYRIKKAPAILTFKNGTTRRAKVPVSLDTDVLIGSGVSETLVVDLPSVLSNSELKNLKMMEIKFASNEYRWDVDSRQIACALDLRSTC